MITDTTSILDSRNLGANPNVTIIAFIICLTLVVLAIYRSYRRPRTTKLKGPPRNDLIFGATKELFNASNLGGVYGDWEKTYGPVYQIPSILGSTILVLQDPRAITHLYSKDTSAYHQSGPLRAAISYIMGDVVLITEGETHKRQRRALSSAFTNTATKDLASVFFRSGYKLKAAWDSAFQGSQNDALILDVQRWLNYLTLDSIGMGGFSHDFGSLKGNASPVMTAFDSFGTIKPSFSIMFSFLLGLILPQFSSRIPNDRKKSLDLVALSSRRTATELLDKAAKEKAGSGSGDEVDKSILGALVRSMNASSKVHMSAEEVMSQMLFFVAGYETTSAALTWALIELARNHDVQETLRAELCDELGNREDGQLVNSLPYLDAFTSELLRMHPSVPEITREVHVDDTLQLTHPIHTASGELLDRIFVAKGTLIRIPVAGINKSEILWGMDADKFDPKRWLDSNHGEGGRWTEIQGYKHLMTFGNGARTCLGKNFAINEIKVVLSVLVRHFRFELPDGPSTKLGTHRSIGLRPKVAGQEGPKVPLIVRRMEQ